MTRPRNLLNVRAQLERLIAFADFAIDEADKAREGGVRLPPLFRDELNAMRFMAKVTLRKAEKSRKDLRVEVQS